MTTTSDPAPPDLRAPVQPFRAFICKVASRCNLDCDYCYMYHHADQSWRDQPLRMHPATAALLGRRINDHAVAHGVDEMEVVLHGGEPLLLGVDGLDALCTAITRNAPEVPIRFSVQTNGTLLDEEFMELARTWNLGFGLSVDGPRAINDRHRLDHAGRSHFDGIERALTLLSSPEGRPHWGGLLSVIDLEADPLDVYAYLHSFVPPSMDFLLPLAHHDMPPPWKRRNGEDGTARPAGRTPYADWLLQIFHAWYRERPQPTRIRRFAEIITLALGAESASEEWGLRPVDFVVVETNGEIQAVDSLKSTFPGACRLGLNILDHSFDDALDSPMVRARLDRWSSLAEECTRCDLVGICGGGYFPHRYSAARGFRNPSVYCLDLMKLIREITMVVREDLSRVAGAAVPPATPGVTGGAA